MKRILLTIVYLHILVMASIAQEHRITVSATTQGFIGLKIRYEYEVGHEMYAGAFYHISALMLAQGDFDTGELGFSFTTDLPFEKFSLDCLIETGYRFQNQNLGFIQTVFINTLARATVQFGVVSPGLELGWEQAIVTHLVYSDFVKSTFEGIYDGAPAPPAGSVLWFPSGRLKTGVSCGIAIGDRFDFAIAGGLLYTPNPFISGFEGMAFGFFPFYADVRFGVDL